MSGSESPLDVVNRFAALASEVAPSDRILSRLLARGAERFGDRTLFICEGERWSFAEAPGIAASAAHALSEAGIRAGDRVAILSANRPEFMRIFLGCAWLGAVAVPINTALRGAQLEHILRNAGPALLVIEDALRPSLDTVEPALLPRLVWWIGTGAAPTAPDGSAWRVPMPAGTAEPAPARPGDTVAILYTSGTTGPSKGVCCPQAQMFWWGIMSARALGIRDGDTLFTTLPLFHTNALNAFYQALVNGCTYAVERRFSASRFWERAHHHGATVTYLLGAMPAMLLAQAPAPSDRAHRVRVALGGGVPGHLHAPFAERFGVPLLDAYGSTETNFVFASAIPSERPGSMGRLVAGVDASIVDENDTPLPDGEAGELVLRAAEPFAFATGYFGMPDKTVEAWRNLWFHTGDRVRREPDGTFVFVDRMKDTIRRRGENVSSWEVEQVLGSHPAIAACAAYPVPSELGEDEVAVAIALEPGTALAPEEVMAHCENRLAYFAVPRFVRFLAAMPLTENGKIKKVALRQDGRTPDIWDREAAGYLVRR